MSFLEVGEKRGIFWIFGFLKILRLYFKWVDVEGNNDFEDDIDFG